MKKILVLVFLISFVGSVAVSPQPAKIKVNGTPYSEGENLVYEGKFKPLFFAFTVADFNFLVSKVDESDDYQVRVKGTSRGTLVKLFNFKFFQTIDSTVDSDKLQILKTAKRDEQGKRVRESEAKFDYDDKRVTYVETDPNDPSRPPRRVASTIEENTQDMISAVYMLRRLPLAVGKEFVLKVSDSGLVYDIPVKVTGRERQKSILGRQWCWKAEPMIFGKGRFIEQKGSLAIWITDDERRIPVRAKLGTKYGPIEIKLRKIGNSTQKSAS